MDDNGLTVLAKRENAVFFIFPLLTPLWWMLFSLANNEAVSFSYLLLIPSYVMSFVWLVCLLRFVRRLFLPTVITIIVSRNSVKLHCFDIKL